LATPAERIPPFERFLRDFLAPLGVDLDAHSAIFLLYRTALDVEASLELGALRDFGLSHAGFALLMTIWVTGPREIRELAFFLRLSRAAVVGTVHTVQRAGLVRRVRSDEDRRLVRVELTEEGRGVIERAQAAIHRCEVELTRDLTLDEQRTLAALLRRVGHMARSRLRRG
jgi:MarR family transcriptional regulator, 2-MHQ and catechol-resistance regulon repressor